MTELLLKKKMLDADCWLRNSLMPKPSTDSTQIKNSNDYKYEVKNYLSVPLTLLLSIKNNVCFSGPSHNGSSFFSLISSTLLLQTRFRNCSNAFGFGSYSIAFPGTCWTIFGTKIISLSNFVALTAQHHTWKWKICTKLIFNYPKSKHWVKISIFINEFITKNLLSLFRFCCCCCDWRINRISDVPCTIASPNVN